MRELKRNDCAVLHLGLKRHWYKMIDSGVKMVEFREAKTYWQTRIANWTRKMHEGKTPVLEFHEGYGRFASRMAFIAGRGEGVVFARFAADDPVQFKELGEFQPARYALFIGERVWLKN